MTHVYRFEMMSNQDATPLEVLISYTSQSILPNDSLERLARMLIAQSVTSWLMGDGDLIDDYVSLNVLKGHLQASNQTAIADWLDNFSDLSMHSLNEQPWTCIWIILS